MVETTPFLEQWKKDAAALAAKIETRRADQDRLHWCWKCACNMTRFEIEQEQCCGYLECPLQMKFEDDQYHKHVQDWLFWIGG